MFNQLVIDLPDWKLTMDFAAERTPVSLTIVLDSEFPGALSQSNRYK
jgi:hypothetical protein